MTENDWIPIEKELPLEEWKSEENIGICDEFLVTVKHNDLDPNDDPEVMLLWFDNKLNRFSTDICGESYEETHDWHVTAWMKKPKPYKFREK